MSIGELGWLLIMVATGLLCLALPWLWRAGRK